MYNLTTNNVQSNYFTTVNQDSQQIKPFNRLVTIKKNHSDALLRFTKPVVITENKGLALLVMTSNPEDKEAYQYVILQNSVQIKANTYFNTLALTDSCQLYLEPSENEDPNIINLKDRIQVKQNKSKVKVNEIYGLHYQVYSSGERIINHNKGYYELLVVDQGEARMEVGYKNHPILSKNYAWLIFPEQKNQIYFHKDCMTTLISVLFQAEGISDSIAQRPINLGHRQIQLVERLVNLSTKTEEQIPYFYDEMMTSLQLILNQMLNGESQSHQEIQTSMRENYENELFQSIIDFLENHVSEQNEVSDLVERFNVSRSSIQSLFKKYTGYTPKQYINSLRLKQSKLLIHESKMTISEIAEKLGYGSIQYFSRAFSKEFGISPSNYAKSIIK